jgi:hypothetical protein
MAQPRQPPSPDDANTTDLGRACACGGVALEEEGDGLLVASRNDLGKGKDGSMAL